MKIKSLILCLFLLFPQIALGATTSPVSLYKSYVDVTPMNFDTPRTVKAVLPSSYFESQFSGSPLLIVDMDSQKTTKTLSFSPTISMFGVVNTNLLNASQLFTDSSYSGQTRFQGNSSFIDLRYPKGGVEVKSITLNGFSVPADLVLELEVRAGDEVVLNRSVIKDFYNIPVSSVRSENLTLTFWYNQPFSLSKIFIETVDYSAAVPNTSDITWTAKPNTPYRIYFGLMGQSTSNYYPADKFVYYDQEFASTVEMKISEVKSNPNFVDPDEDKDGVTNTIDNCLFGSNPNQEDENNDGIGDACEDFDKDYVQNYMDNCPTEYNTAQADIDNDGIGDACDNFENRITERLPYLPWIIIGLAGILMVYIIVSNLKKSKQQ